MSEDLSLEVQRIINADPQTIFEALTDPEILQQWFYAGSDAWSATVDANPEIGGTYQIDMHSPDATNSHTGKYKEIVPNEKIVFTWNSEEAQDTLVTITLREVDEGTKIRLQHNFMPNEEAVKNHTKGWTIILQRLETLTQDKA